MDSEVERGALGGSRHKQKWPPGHQGQCWYTGRRQGMRPKATRVVQSSRICHGGGSSETPMLSPGLTHEGSRHP